MVERRQFKPFIVACEGDPITLRAKLDGEFNERAGFTALPTRLLEPAEMSHQREPDPRAWPCPWHDRQERKRRVRRFIHQAFVAACCAAIATALLTSFVLWAGAMAWLPAAPPEPLADPRSGTLEHPLNP